MRQLEQQRLDTRQRKIQKAVRKVLPDLDRVSYEEQTKVCMYYAGEAMRVDYIIHVWDKEGHIPYSAYACGTQTTKQLINAILAEIKPITVPMDGNVSIHPPMSNDEVDDSLPF